MDMETFKLIERDIVTHQIYTDFVYEKNMEVYYFHANVYNKTYVSMLPMNEKDARSTFYYYSMLLCGFYDTYGEKSFIDAVKKYVSKKPIERIYSDKTEASIKKD